MAVRKRDHLLAVAQRMFCETGFHAVSVDAILEEAGVARMTLYKNFGSKEELIVATLKCEDRMFRQWLVSAVEAQSDHSQDRIPGLSDALHDRLASEGYYGCAFILAIEGTDSMTLSEQLYLLFEGAINRLTASRRTLARRICATGRRETARRWLS